MKFKAQFNTELEIIFISNLRKTKLYSLVLWSRWGVPPLLPFSASSCLTLHYRQTDLFPGMMLSNCHPGADLHNQTVGGWGYGSGDGSCGLTVVFDTFWRGFWTACPHAACLSVYSAPLSSHWWPIVLPDLQPLLVIVADVTRVLLLCWYFASTSQVTGTNQ